MSARGDLPEALTFVGIEVVGGSQLRASFEVVDAAGVALVAYVGLSAGGAVIDLQSSDGHAGSTGRPGLDELVTRRARAELARARAAATVMSFDRRQARRTA